MTAFDLAIRDAVLWAKREGHTMPVVWYRGQPEAPYDHPGVREMLRGLIRRRCALRWQARVVWHELAGVRIVALAVSIEPLIDPVRVRA